MVEQLGLAIMPLCFKAASPFTSGITKGHRSSIRQALVLSITAAPCEAHFQASALDTVPLALEKTISASKLPSSGIALITRSLPLKERV